MGQVLDSRTPPRATAGEGPENLLKNPFLPSSLVGIAIRPARGPEGKSTARPRRVKRLPCRLMLFRKRPRRARLPERSGGEVIVGTLAGVNDSGEPLVQHPLDRSGRIILARTTVPLDHGQVGRHVVIAFEEGDLARPIVLGVVCRPDDSLAAESIRQPPTVRLPVKAAVDGEQLVLSADREIVLQCGEASITLTRAGKILLRGTYLLSRASGVNRIKGGSVQIN